MRRLLALAALSLALLALAACSGGDDNNGVGTPTNVATLIPGNYSPLIVTQYTVVGDNRFVVGVIKNDDSSQVVSANLHERFFKLGANSQGTLKFEQDATAIVSNKTYVDTHPDGTHEVHQAGTSGAYVTHPNFDTTGDWGVEVSGKTKDGDTIGPVNLGFKVLATDPGIGVGSPLPPTKQQILSDVTDIGEIDTSAVPIPEEHNLTVADALKNGKPTVIAFATPQFCVSMICGPTKQNFDDMYNEFKGQANFVHIEPYIVPLITSGECTNFGDCLSPASVDFKLPSEPWVFIADSQGILRAKFDGIVSNDELRVAIQGVLGSSPAASATAAQ
jgi:hypothetical protein